jgi:hypothetical protein
MASSSRSAVRLARRLRELRREWPGGGLTQQVLAKGLSQETTVGSPTLSSWESLTSPRTPTRRRLDAYARFFATERSYDGTTVRLLRDSELDEDELAQFHELREELLGLLHDDEEADELEAEVEVEVDLRRTLLEFEQGPVIIICPEAPTESRGPLAAEISPNFSRLHTYADTDALLELFGHVRALNPEAKVFVRSHTTIQPHELQSHIVVLGGIGWNPTTKRILDQLGRLPVAQVEDPRLPTGDIFKLKKDDAEGEQFFLPVTDPDTAELVEDVALIARLPNPFNSSRTLTICNGIHSRGVVGAVLAITDETVRPANEEFLAHHFPTNDFAMLVRVHVVTGNALAPDFKNPEARLFEWAPEAEEERA